MKKDKSTETFLVEVEIFSNKLKSHSLKHFFIHASHKKTSILLPHNSYSKALEVKKVKSRKKKRPVIFIQEEAIAYATEHDHDMKFKN